MTDDKYRIIDLGVFAVANLTNVLMAGVFLARFRGAQRIEFNLGIIAVAMIVPLVVAVVFNLTCKREWWTVVLPLVLILYLLVELLLDYVFKIPFRDTALIWPYILLFYAGLMAMIGYTFLVGRVFGAITLVTYFVQLAVMLYTHMQKGIHQP
jgi:Flp pilus assembly pilin Flp